MHLIYSISKKFKKDYTKIQALIDFGSKINIIILAYIAIFELHICLTDVLAQKIDGFILLIYSMI